MGGQITALKVQKRNRERVNVYIDEHFAFGLALVEALQLKVGQHLSDAEIAQLKQKDNVEVARERALRFLSYRPRSTAEVRRYLAKKEFGASAVEQAIERLSRVGLLDDRAFTKFWIENRDTFKPRGIRALRYELRQKGVADSIIDEFVSDYDESDAAYRAALPKARALAKRHDADTFRTKLLAYLNRRGFPFYVARDTVDSFMEELGEEGADVDN
jgi:regulatory protein